MQQVYHSNATTNVNIREQIQENSTSSNIELATRFGTSVQTVSKWRNRDFTGDYSCVPKNINYALTETEMALAVSIRSATWFPLDEVHETLLAQNENIARSSVYRCFVKNKILPMPIKCKLLYCGKSSSPSVM